jgi:hypothetical protein
MLRLTQRFGSMMRKIVLLAMVAAIVAMPMAFAGVGLCRSMPCCPRHVAATASQLHQPDCCNTTNCDQPPDIASEYTKTSRVQQHAGPSGVVSMAVLPVAVTIGPPRATQAAIPSVAPPSLQRRMAILSVLLI